MERHSVTLHTMYDIEAFTQIVVLVCSCGAKDKFQVADDVPFKERAALIDEAARALAARPGAPSTSPQANVDVEKE